MSKNINEKTHNFKCVLVSFKSLKDSPLDLPGFLSKRLPKFLSQTVSWQIYKISYKMRFLINIKLKKVFVKYHKNKNTRFTALVFNTSKCFSFLVLISFKNSEKKLRFTIWVPNFFVRIESLLLRKS
jgi:hypothetical protein